MSLTADIADAIIALDKKLAHYELALRRVSFETGDDLSTPLEDMAEWVELKDAIETMQHVALGEGMHFDEVEDAFAFRDYDPEEYRDIIERPAPPA